MEFSKVLLLLTILSVVSARKNSTQKKFDGKKVAKRDVFYLGYGSNNKIYAIPTVSENGSNASPFSFIQPYKGNVPLPNSGYKVSEDAQKQVENIMKAHSVPGGQNFYQYNNEREADGDNESPQNGGGGGGGGSSSSSSNQGLTSFSRNHLDQHQQGKLPMQPFDVIKLIQENAIRQAGIYKNINSDSYRHYLLPPGHQNGFDESQPHATFLQPPVSNNPYNRIYQQLESAKYNLENGDEGNQFTSPSTDLVSSPTNQPLHVVQPIVLNNLNDLPQLIAATLNRNANNNKYGQRDLAESASQQIKIVPTLSTVGTNDQQKISASSNNNGGNERFNLLPNLNSRSGGNEHVKVLSSNQILVPSSHLYRLSNGRFTNHAHGGSKRSFDGYSEENMSGEMPAGDTRRNSYDFDQLSEQTNTESSMVNIQQTNPVAKQLNLPNYETVPEAQDRISDSFPSLPNFLTTQMPTVPTQFMGLGVNPNHALQQSLERYAKIASVLNKQKQQQQENAQSNNYETLLQNLQNEENTNTNQITGTVPTAVIVNDKNHIAFLNSYGDVKRKNSEILENAANQQKFANLNSNLIKELSRQVNNRNNVYGFPENVPKVFESPEQNFKATEKPNIIIYPILNNGFTVRPDEYPKLVQKILGDKFNDIKTLLNNYPNGRHQHQHQHHQLSTEIPFTKYEQVNELKNYQREGRSGDNHLVQSPLGDYHIISSPNAYNPLNNKFSFISFTMGGDARHKRKIAN